MTIMVSALYHANPARSPAIPSTRQASVRSRSLEAPRSQSRHRLAPTKEAPRTNARGSELTSVSFSAERLLNTPRARDYSFSIDDVTRFLISLMRYSRLFAAGTEAIKLVAYRLRTRGPFLNGNLEVEVSQVLCQHLYRLGYVGLEPIVSPVMSPPLKQEGHQFSVRLFFINFHDLLLDLLLIIPALGFQRSSQSPAS